MVFRPPDVERDPGLGEEGCEPDPPPVIGGEEVVRPVPEVARVDVGAGEEGVAEALGPG